MMTAYEMSNSRSASPVHDDVARALDALDFLEPPLDRDSWVKLLMAAHDAGISEDEAMSWSARGSNFNERDFRSVWRNIKPGAITVRTLYKAAIDAGWCAPTERKSFTAEQIAQHEAERKRRREQADKEKAEEEAAAAERAKAMWEAATPCESHPYLSRKGVGAHEDVRVGNWEYVNATTGKVYSIPNCLLIPMYDRQRNIYSLQCIEPNENGGGKWNLKGGRKKGCFFPFGKAQTINGRNVFILGEGYSTCASIYEDTGHMVLMCVDASNLVNVAASIRERDADAIILIAGDNDIWKRKADGTPYNPGKLAAEKAAKAVNGIVALPPFTEADAAGTDEKGNPIGPKDFNDLYAKLGPCSVQEVIDAALYGQPMAGDETTETVPVAPHVILAPTMRDARAVEYALMLANDLEPEVSCLAGVGPNAVLDPDVFPYDKLGLENMVRAVRNVWPTARIDVLAEHADAAKGQRVEDEFGVSVSLPKNSEGWPGWGEAYLDLVFDAIGGDDEIRQLVNAELRKLATVTSTGPSDASAEVDRQAQEVAKAIGRKLAKAFKFEPGAPDYRQQIDAFGIDAEVIGRMVNGSFWSGAKSKLFFLNGDEALNQYTAGDAYKFLERAFGGPVDGNIIEAAVEAAAMAPGMSKGDAKELRRSVADAVSGPILDHLKYENQRESVEWRTDMFASKARVQLSQDKARIVLTHKPFEVPGSYDPAIIADYKQHFARFEEFLEFLVMSRFALDRKKCYLWIKADSDWGKGFLMGVLSGLGLVVCTSMKEVEAMFEGKPVGRAPEDFKRAFALIVDEFKMVKSELKQLQSEITLSPKHQLTASVEVFAKLLFSAESVASLVTENGVEDQFANRMSIFQETGSLDKRPLFIESKPRYFNSVLAYTAETLNSLVEKMQKMGRIEAQTCAERWINGFIGRNGLDTLYERFSESMPQVAADALPWIYNQSEEYLVSDGIGPESRYYLTSANKVLDEYINAHFDASEAPGYRKKKPDLLRALSADGRGVAVHWINGKSKKAVLLMKAGSSASDLAAKKQ